MLEGKQDVSQICPSAQINPRNQSDRQSTRIERERERAIEKNRISLKKEKQSKSNKREKQ